MQPRMTPELLHQHVKRSLWAPVAKAYVDALQSLLLSGSSEHFLTDLLFLTMRGAGYDVSREFPLGKGHKCDLVLHDPAQVMIEVKQLHLKDGCRYAKNLAQDLRRHPGQKCFGVMYILDERACKPPRHFDRFQGKNRKVKDGVDQLLPSLTSAFRIVVPTSAEAALLRSFDDDGRLDLFGFVLKEPCGA